MMMMTSGTALYCKKEAEHAGKHAYSVVDAFDGTNQAMKMRLLRMRMRMQHQWRRRRPACEG